jgi:hypothetical protein
MARTESHHEKLLELIAASGGWHELNRAMRSCWNRLQPDGKLMGLIAA